MRLRSEHANCHAHVFAFSQLEALANNVVIQKDCCGEHCMSHPLFALQGFLCSLTQVTHLTSSSVDISGTPWDPRNVKHRWHFHEYITFMIACLWRLVGVRLASSLGLRLPDQCTFGALTYGWRAFGASTASPSCAVSNARR